jgi:hypothetical protein
MKDMGIEKSRPPAGSVRAHLLLGAASLLLSTSGCHEGRYEPIVPLVARTPEGAEVRLRHVALSTSMVDGRTVSSESEFVTSAPPGTRFDAERTPWTCGLSDRRAVVDGEAVSPTGIDLGGVHSVRMHGIAPGVPLRTSDGIERCAIVVRRGLDEPLPRFRRVDGLALGLAGDALGQRLPRMGGLSALAEIMIGRWIGPLLLAIRVGAGALGCGAAYCEQPPDARENAVGPGLLLGVEARVVTGSALVGAISLRAQELHGWLPARAGRTPASAFSALVGVHLGAGSARGWAGEPGATLAHFTFDLLGGVAVERFSGAIRAGFSGGIGMTFYVSR